METKPKKKRNMETIRKVAGCLKDANDIKQAQEILSLRDEDDRVIETIEQNKKTLLGDGDTSDVKSTANRL